ncbi:MAG: hypothetical protein LBJ14_03950 [Desulfarculales bacterium]|jgi:hypothetical protein|nr:hypothetical protein [Desulfarculales bacterium]
MADTAYPVNPVPLIEPDVYEACREFVLTYALPALTPDTVIQDWRKHISLPPETDDYAVISILFDSQHGTAVETFIAPEPDKNKPGILTVQALVEVRVQIDFCSEDDKARQRARRLGIVAGSSIGAQFFNERGMSALYAGDVRELSFTGAANQFVKRYAITLHLSLNEGITVEYPYFDSAKASRVEDADAHHPITRSF